ncbi:DUF805 domain-containing protein [uncultured Veillonella sp.]|uniref:DUF805 domain-containing protein n=1 Tax=uncultured Veillonella sp. TaxID=159268 RepID=UPI00261DC3FF|nr:DUF805 domain-containing protein [uncultured Veillonella sp.]
MFCIYCGHEIPQDGKFCPRCGRPVVKKHKDAGSTAQAKSDEAFTGAESEQTGQVPYGAPPDGHQPYGTPPNGASPYGTPPNGYSPYGTPPNGASPYGTPPNGYSPYGMPPNGASPYGTQSNGYFPNGMPPSGASPYGTPPNGYPPYGMMPPGGPPYGYPLYEWQMGPWVGSLDIWSVFKESMTSKFNDISGRMTRAEYFRFILVILTLSVLVEVGALLLKSDPLLDIVYYGMIFIFTIPVLSAGIRRLHDSGMSAFWILLEIPSRVISFLIGPNEAGQLLLPLLIVADVMSFIFLLLCLRKSQRFSNQYGPLPDYTYYVKEVK